ncbi:MAG: phage major capsid protein, partial [Neisseriaceae bacterium]|nr:phage major capsid protein [Neisseriaceae bacterium]
DDPTPIIDTTTGQGWLKPYREEFKTLPRRHDLLEIIPEVVIGASSIEIPREKAVTGNAAVVPEGTSKPYIGIETEKVLLPMKTIAAMSKLTTQMLEDENTASVQSHVDTTLSYKCDLELERQIIAGDGTGNNFSGLLTNATQYVRPTGAGDKITVLDDLLAATLQLEMTGFKADAIILHPMDYWKLATAKDDVGGYTLSDPRGDLVRRVWATRMVTTQGLPQGSFIVADIVGGTTLYRRGNWKLALGYVNDDFAKNLITVRKEGAANLAVFNSLAVLKGTFAANGGN